MSFQSAEHYQATKSLLWDAANGCDDSNDDAADTRLDEFKDSSGRIDWEAVYDSGICDECDDSNDQFDADELFNLCNSEDCIDCDDDVPF